ncbi:MAG: malto-oligosyltrehalose synthase [Sinimarinibacterium flocculans]|uniref:malto-oligosyltrehalose synthase n=1 Tax=Sinimarinibacterium flocculans TaxID=985250 RepID=UPI003C3818CF
MIAPEQNARIDDERPIPPQVPRGSLRLQLHRGYDFDAATATVPYLHALGVSHLFASPILAARPGSAHGYDVIDHDRINPELGGEDGLRRLVAALRRHGMGLIVDIVPNHMAIDNGNRRWRDMLEWGRRSPSADFFDIDWDSTDPALRGRVLLPFLGEPYGEALDAGALRLHLDAADGRLHVAYYEHRFPIAAEQYPLLLEAAGMRALAARFRLRGSRPRDALRRAFDDGRAALAAAAGDPGVAKLLQAYDAGTDAGRSRLHELLERQHYRLAWWRSAADQINWRRFFDILELPALRMQDVPVFEAAHATIFRLYAEGLIDGLRIDHVDGLADPRRYCRRLRLRLQQLQAQRPPDAAPGPAYVVVEKILAPRERLARDWLVDGTSGYTFMNEVGALLHDPAGEAALTQLWRTIGGDRGFDEEERRARRYIALELFPAEFNACAHALHTIARSQPRWRDWPLAAVRRVLAELLAHFPVYRTYVDDRGRSAADAAIMREVTAAAMRSCRPGEQALVTLVDRWLGGERPSQAGPAKQRRMRLRAVARFQQLTSRVAAKAVEDTAFYRHGRLLSRNEVGADPAQFSMSAGDFHRAARLRGQRYPRAMLTTATHDHKRGEDVRARLSVLSECPQRWAEAVERWSQRHAPLRQPYRDGVAPDDIDQYMLYQMMVGCWPPTLQPHDADGLAAFAERLWQWQRKAIREAKRHGNWIDPDTQYETHCEHWLRSVLDVRRDGEFPRMVEDFLATIAPAGAAKGLAQTLLRMTVPGVPDLYQGADFWDLSMVDPDNRRAVDFAARDAALAQAGVTSGTAQLERWQDGAIKQRLIARVLGYRARHPALFERGSYRPLRVRGPLSSRMIAFARSLDGQAIVVVVPRFTLGLLDEHRGLRPDAAVLAGSELVLPRPLAQRRWRPVLDDGPAVPTAHGCIALNAALCPWPLALLTTDGREA